MIENEHTKLVNDILVPFTLYKRSISTNHTAYTSTSSFVDTDVDSEITLSSNLTYGSINQKGDETLIEVSSHRCSAFGASLNLVNAIMGTGILGLPLALHLCGFWLGLLCSVIVACLFCLSMYLTIVCGLKTQTFSLAALTEKLIGPVGSYIFNFIIFFHSAGTAVSYYIVLGDTLPNLISLVLPDCPFLSNRTHVVLLFGLLFTLPLSLSRSTANFAKWSAISVILLLLALVGVFVRLPYYISLNGGKIELEAASINGNLFKGIAIMSLSFGCSQNLFGVYTTTKNQKPSGWLLVCFITIIITFLINMSFAVLTYLCFTKDVKANVLLNFPETDPGIRLVKLSLGLFMVLTIPLCLHPCRESAMLLFGIDANKATNKQHYVSTIGVFAVILYFGATLTSLGKVFDIVGGFSTIVLAFLLPGFAYVYLFREDLFDKNDREAESANKKGTSWFLFIMSCLIVLLGIPVIWVSLRNTIFK